MRYSCTQGWLISLWHHINCPSHVWHYINKGFIQPLQMDEESLGTFWWKKSGQWKQSIISQDWSADWLLGGFKERDWMIHPLMISQLWLLCDIESWYQPVSDNKPQWSFNIQIRRCCATNFWQHKTRYGRIQPETTRYGNIKLNTEEYNKIPLVFLLYCHVALTVVGCDYH